VVVLHDWPPGQLVLSLQPQAPAMHTWPTELLVQSTHALPVAPQALLSEPIKQVPGVPLQQPVEQAVWLASPQAISQTCVVLLHDFKAPQSAATLQPHTPATHALPFALPVQLAHVMPFEPQVVAPVPALQVPELQQPPLHGCVPLHVVVHACVVVLHALPLGQSLVMLQPQLAPPMHAWPARLAVQSTHVPPDAPHAFAAAPPAQLVPLQQPPLQFCELEQVVEHKCVEVLHALPAGQSVVALQPQLLPPMHTWPLALMVQSTHTVPPEPHEPAALPPTHAPLVMPLGMLQQPLAHGDEALQPEPHRCVAMLHAVPGQSVDELQPHALITHACPLADVEQSRQARPLAPQLAAPVPPLQLPAEQQPPLHACDAEQLVVHKCVVVLHAVFIAQSVVAPQPHAPPPATISHTVPLGLATQVVHAPPPVPHAVCAVPGTQVPLEQQPPLQVCVAVQVVVQRMNDGSHA
jgi:hypothetical protein